MAVEEKIAEALSKLSDQMSALNKNLSEQNDPGNNKQRLILDPETKEDLTRIIRKLGEETEKSQDELHKAGEALKKALTPVLAANESRKGDFKKIDESDISASQKAARFDRLIDEMEASKELDSLTAEEIKKRRDQIKKLEKQQKDLEESDKNFRRLQYLVKPGVDDLFSKINIKSQQNNPLWIIGAELAKGGAAGQEILTYYKKLVGDELNHLTSAWGLITNGLSLFKDQTFKMLGEMDQTTAAFSKATGIVGVYNDAIVDTWKDLRTMNVTVGEVGEAFRDMLTDFSGFSRMTQQGQRSVVEMSAVMKRLGVSTGDSAALFSSFIDGMGVGVDEAKGMIGGVLGIAQSTGDSLNKVVSALKASLPELAKYGKSATTVFKDVYATAKALRIETSELLNIAKGFDTFDQAAQSVGRLNAIMGGPYLNTLQLMQQNEGERIQTLYQAFQATGKNWLALNKFEKQAIATAAGISDMDVAQKIFNGSLSELNAFTRQQEIDQKKLNERSKLAATLSEKWQSILSSLAVIAKPFLDALTSILSVFSDISKTLGGWTIPAFFAAIVVFKGLFSVLSRFSSGIFSKIGDGISGLFKKGKDLAKDAEVGGGVFGKIGSAIGGFGEALSKAGPGLLKAAGIIAIGILAIKSAWHAAEGIGKGIGHALGSIFDSFGSVFDAFNDWITDSPMEEFNDEFIDPLRQAGPAFAANAREARLFYEVMAKYGSQLSNINSGAFDGLSDSIITLSESFSSFDFSNIASLGLFAESMAKMNETAVTLTPEVVKNYKTFLDNIVEYKKDISVISSFDSGGIEDKISGMAKAIGALVPKVSVNVELDGDQIAKNIEYRTEDRRSPGGAKPKPVGRGSF